MCSVWVVVVTVNNKHIMHWYKFNQWRTFTQGNIPRTYVHDLDDDTIAIIHCTKGMSYYNMFGCRGGLSRFNYYLCWDGWVESSVQMCCNELN